MIENTRLSGILNNQIYSKYLVLILTILSFMLWSISLIQAKQVPIGEYGLFSVLPITFYAGFFILLISIYLNVFYLRIEGRIKVLLIIQLFLVMAFIFFTPALIEGTTRAPHSWQKYQYTDYIINNNKLHPGLLYHKWPAPFIISAELQFTTSMEHSLIPLVFPLMIDIMIFFSIILFFNRFFKDWRAQTLAVLIFYIIVWTNQFHYAPQIFAFFLLILILYFINFRLADYNIKNLFVLILLILTLALTHLLTLVIAVGYLGLVITLQFLEKIKTKNWEKENVNKFSLKKLKYPIFIIVILSVIYFWFSFAESWLKYVDWEFKPDLIFRLAESYFAKISDGSDAHGVLVVLRMLFSLIIASLALIGSYLTFNKNKRLAMFLLIFSGIFPIFLFYYGVEIVQRAFLLCSLPLSALMIMGIDRKKFLTLLIVFSFIAIPIHMLAMYGNEKLDYTPPSQITGAEFVFEHIDEGVLLSRTSVEWSRFVGKYKWGGVGDILTDKDQLNNTYLLYTTSGENWILWYQNDETFITDIKETIENNEYIKVYDSPDFIIYRIK